MLLPSWHKEMMEGCYDSFIYDVLCQLYPCKEQQYGT